jgi:hypothetical protein
MRSHVSVDIVLHEIPQFLPNPGATLFGKLSLLRTTNRLANLKQPPVVEVLEEAWPGRVPISARPRWSRAAHPTRTVRRASR